MELDVLMNGVLAGVLRHTAATNRFDFAYDPAWLARADRYALCPALPLEPAPGLSADVHSAAVRQFFENLLPEGQALDDAARTYKVSKANLMGLLSALGRETAGALQLRLSGASSAEDVRDELRPLSHAELSQRIRERPEQPFSVWDGRVRLSIAGYQDKIAVFEERGEWYLVEGSRLASTHIIKPEPVSRALAGLTANEYFCMRLARFAKLPVADVRFVQVPEPVLTVRRFDREVTRQGVARRHVIDGCQALGLPSALKYERPYGDRSDVRHIRDGASLPQLFALLEQSPHPAAQRLALLRWTIFQVLIGNTDAHAKNLSFFAGADGLLLAPAYDLVCGLAFDSQTLLDTYALAIGDAFHPRELTPFEWASFAHACGLPLRQVSKELRDMARKVLELLPKAFEDAAGQGVAPELADRLAGLIRDECVRQIELAPAVAQVSPTLL